MINVGVVVPSWLYFADPFKLQPSHELYIATVIDAHFKYDGVMADIVDFRENRRRRGGMFVEKKDLFLYWITKTADYPDILNIVKSLKTIYPDSKHIAGGTHVEAFQEECKNDFDAIVVGPGEVSFIDVIYDHIYGAIKKTYHSDWRKINYSDYPFPKRHYLARNAVVNTELFKKYGEAPSTSVMFSRGCPYKCIYCTYRMPPFSQRRTLEHIKKEIQYLKDEYYITALNLRDEISIPTSKKEAIAFLNMLKSCNVIWRGQSRIIADREILQLAKESGCVELALGVESVSQQVLDIMNKKQTLAQIKKCFQLCNEFDIKTKMCLIIGAPGEPTHIVQLTKQFIEQVKPTYVNISGICPIPGSEMFDNPKKFGIARLDNDWSKFFHLIYRYSDNEKCGIPFDYEEHSKFGETFSRDEIIQNIKELQHFAQERNMVY